MNDSYHGHKCSSPSGVCGSSKMGHICTCICNSHWIIVYLVADVYDCIASADLRLEYKRIATQLTPSYWLMSSALRHEAP